MGRDKAALDVEGEPAARRLARLLGALCDDVLVVGGAVPEGAPGRAVPDPPGPRSALRGLVGALAAAEHPRVWVVATDYFGLDARLLLALLAMPAADAVVPRDAHRHPLCALYARDAARAVAEAALARGTLRLDGMLDALDVRWLEGPDLALAAPDSRVLRNVNTPDELAAFHAEGRA